MRVCRIVMKAARAEMFELGHVRASSLIVLEDAIVAAHQPQSRPAGWQLKEVAGDQQQVNQGPRRLHWP